MVTDKIQDSVEITRWDRKYRDDFIRLNSEWIEIFFLPGGIRPEDTG